MTAEVVEAAASVTLTRHEAASLAAVVRRILGASHSLLGGGRQLDAEDLAALKRGTAQLAMRVYSIGDQSAEVIDLDQQRARRRR